MSDHTDVGAYALGLLEEPDRVLRQEAWELVAARRLQDAEKCDEIFDELIKLRCVIRAFS